MLSKKLYLHVVQFINWQLILLEYLLYGIEFVCFGYWHTSCVHVWLLVNLNKFKLEEN